MTYFVLQRVTDSAYVSRERGVSNTLRQMARLPGDGSNIAADWGCNDWNMGCLVWGTMTGLICLTPVGAFGCAVFILSESWVCAMSMVCLP